MVLGVFKKKPRDLYLYQTIQTDRFELINLSWLQAFRVTLPWANDPETLHFMTYDRSSYSTFVWAIRLPIPNGRTFFVHAVKPKFEDKVIGVHILRITLSGTVTLMMGLTDQTWTGKGVFEEARTSLMDHFSRSPRVVRFAGQVLARNASSVYIYKKMGFRFVGYEKKSWRSPYTNELLDIVHFEYLAEDWRAIRELDLI